MSQKKSLIVSILAAVMAAIFAILFMWGQAQTAANTQAEIIEQFEGGARRILVARSRIESGTSIERNLFSEQTWPGLYLPEGAIDVADFDEVIGRRATATIAAGEALTSLRVLDQQLPLDRLSQGMTALTIPAEDIHALGGQILRGMRINLMADAADGRVRLLVADIEVLSANTAAVQQGLAAGTGADVDTDSSNSFMSGSSDGFGYANNSEPLNWVTLAIPNDQVEQVLTASRAGTIHLVLPKLDLEIDADMDVALPVSEISDYTNKLAAAAAGQQS